MPRETDVQRNDREWREVAIEALDALREKVHALELEAAVMKTKIHMGTFIIGIATSAVVSIVMRWIMK